MYTEHQHTVHSDDTITDLISEYPFATLVANGKTGLESVRTGFLAETDENGSISVLNGHIARANPIWQNLEADAQGLVLFSGPHCYISPTRYLAHQANGKVVPTWNYLAVEVRGKLEIIEDADWLKNLVDKLTSHLEAETSSSWHVNDAPETYINNLLRGTVGIRLHVERIHATQKFNQDKGKDEMIHVASGLCLSENPHERAVGEVMNTLVLEQ